MEFIREHADRSQPKAEGGLRWGVQPICRVLTEHGVSIAPCCGATGEWLRVTDTNVLFDVDRIDEHGTPHRLEWGVTTGGSR